MSPEEAYKTIMQCIDYLDDRHIRMVRSYLYNKLEPPRPERDDVDASLIYDSMMHVIIDRYGHTAEFDRGYKTFVRSTPDDRLALFHERCEQIKNFIDVHLPGLKKVERMKLYMLIMDAVGNRLKREGKSARPNDMIRELENFADCLDGAYPGYMQSKLLSWVVKNG